MEENLFGGASHDFGFSESAKLRLVIKLIGYLLLVLALFSDLNMPTYGLVGLNLILHLPWLFIIQKRFGVDTTAYLNQADQVIRGQRNYADLITNQGNCFYPAGHILIYMPIAWVFRNFENPEPLLFLLHAGVDSLQHVLTVKIASYVLPAKICRIIAFQQLANTAWRREVQSFFNDQLMAFICQLMVVAVAESWHLVSALLLSLAISIKASAIFWLPVFLGVTLRGRGIIILVFSVILMVGWQLCLAAPFLNPFGGDTDFARYIQISKFLGGDGHGG